MTDDNHTWYEAFYGNDYLEALGPSLTNTAKEAEFIALTLGLKAGDQILDLCCGQGRHAVILASLGIKVTGQDQSNEYLNDARAAAAERSIDLPLVKSDMRKIPFACKFDAVINMFTSFGYFETEEEDRQVLTAIHKALKSGGQLLMDLLNRDWVIANNRPADRRVNGDGTIVLERRKLNLETNRNEVTFTFIDSEGNKRESFGHRIRLYTLDEITLMMSDTGFELQRVYGGFDSQPYSASARRMIVAARKSE